MARPAGSTSPDKNTFLWAQELAAWPRLKTFPGGREVHSRFGRPLFCLRYAQRVRRVCSLGRVRPGDARLHVLLKREWNGIRSGSS